MPGLPTGTVTFLFTDIEGSTILLQHLGDRRYAEVLAEHRRLLREAFAEGSGQEVDTQGDAFLVAFSRARDAVGAAVAAQQALTKYPWPDGASLRIRMGLHTGEPVSGTGDYVGLDVHRAARICAAGHGGQILLSDAVSSLAARDLPPGVSLRDLGTHRLKDLQESEHIFQVAHPDLRSEFPPLKSLDALPNNLPRQLTSFIGREREIAEVKRLLSTTCLLTLTGTGGAGKTRLALQVATDVLEHYPDGVWLTQLAPLPEPTLVPKAVASALGIPEQPGRSLTDTVVDYLRPRSLLLVLDNCEHLLEVCAQLADALLQACPNLRIVATSREALGIAGELTYRVPSLSLPDLKRLPPPEALTRCEAVRLFVERAAFSKPGFQITDSNAAVVAQVTHRLDGIPLAIELAAARVKALPIDVIAARLDDQFRLLTGGSRTGLPRHQTLRATLDWSYDLLSSSERILLRRLSVFAGGFTLEAAEKVCAGKGLEHGDILDLLTHLVDKSLVMFDEQDGQARYGLLESLREYGRERLVGAGEATDVRREHRDWYLSLAERAEPELQGHEQEIWLERMETEYDNLRAALEWSLTGARDAEAGMRLSGAISYFWRTHDYFSEGSRWLERALALDSGVSVSVRAKVLHAAGLMLRIQGHVERAAALAEESLVLSRQLGDERGMGYSLALLGTTAVSQGDLLRAKALLVEGLAHCREAGDHRAIALVFNQLGEVARSQGDYEAGRSFYEESLAIRRTTGDKRSIAVTLRNLGDVALYQGDYRNGEVLFRESLFISRKLGNKLGIAESLAGFAGVAVAKGQPERAARLLGAAEVLLGVLGTRLEPPDQAEYDRFVNAARTVLGEAAFSSAWAEGRAMTLGQAIEYALEESN